MSDDGVTTMVPTAADRPYGPFSVKCNLSLTAVLRKKSFVSSVPYFSMQSCRFSGRKKRPSCRMNSSIGSILYYSVKSSRDLRIFVRIIIGKMNKKEIQSFSLATLLDICGRRPEDLYYDGCLIASRVNVKDEFNIDLFRYPTRLDAFAIIFCSKGSIVSTSGVTRHTIGERTLFVHLPGSILQVESVEDARVHAILARRSSSNGSISTSNC